MSSGNREQKVSLGTWITTPHPSVVEILAKSDFQWLCVDLEHSPVSRLEMQTAIALVQGLGKKAFVRIAENTHTAAKFPLDAGADGIIIPMVNSYEAAVQAVQNCLYPPAGKRGVGLARAQGFGAHFNEHLAANLRDLKILTQVEHIDAVRDIERIVTIEKLAGIFVGPYDLSGSMGIPGQLSHPDVLQAIDKVARAVKAAGKLLGAHIVHPDEKTITHHVKNGYDFLALGTDFIFLSDGARRTSDLAKQMIDGNRI